MSTSSDRSPGAGTPDPERSMDASGVAAKELDPELALAMEQISRSLFPLGEATEVRIGRFVVERRLGAGAMGVVYAARDPVLDRRVAIKLVRPEVGSDRKAQLRLEREARALAKVSHPNIVAIHEVGEHHGQLFLAMEHVQGQSLRAWQEREPRSRSAVLAMYVQAGRGLAAAHAAGLVHRDFKPDNVLVDDEGRARVVDFGLVGRDGTERRVDLERWQASEAHAVPLLTQTHALVGTPAYMSAEQFRGLAVDARSDQFAFCVALWEALHGERPFEGKSLLELSSRVLAGRLQAPSKDRRVPSWLRQACERGLAVDPAQRFGSMDELLAALEADPSRRRRRMLVVGGGSLAIALGVGGHAVDRARRVQACEDEAASIAEVWGDAARERVEASLLGTGVSFAPSTWERVEPKLNEYAAAWSEARRSTCLAAEVEGVRSEGLATRTSDCLDEHRTTLAAWVEVLADADARVVQAAATKTLTLPSHEDCTDESRLAQRGQLPADADLREQVKDLRRRLADVRSLEATGRYREGLALGRVLASEAEALGWGPLHAQVLVQLGTVAMGASELELAERVLEQAVDVALRAKDDSSAVRAIEALTVTTGSYLGRHERGIWWGRLGLALSARLGSAQGSREASIRLALASVLGKTGDYAEASELLEQVLASREQELGTTTHPDLARVLTDLGSLRYAQGRLTEAKNFFDRSLAISEAALGTDHPNTAGALANLGMYYGDTGDFTAMKAVYERAAAMLETALGPDHVKTDTARMGLGRAHGELGEYAEGRALFERGLAFRKKKFGPESAQVGYVYYLIAGIRSKMGEHAEAVTLGERALSICEKTKGPEHPEVAWILGDLAGNHQQLGELDEARRLYERALVIGEKGLGPNHHQLAYPLAGLASIAVELGTPQDAIAPAERGLRILEAGPAQPNRLAELRFTLARALWASGGDRERALALAKQAAAEVDRRQAHENLENLEEWIRSAEADQARPSGSSAARAPH